MPLNHGILRSLYAIGDFVTAQPT